MSLLPSSRQLHLDSLQSSFAMFHSTPFKLLRYNSGSSILIKVQSFCSNSQTNKNPHRKPCSLELDRRFSIRSLGKDRTLRGGSSWLFEWNKPSKRNRLKPPKVMVDYGDGGGVSVGGGGGGTIMETIVERLKRNGYIDGGPHDEMGGRKKERVIEKGSIEDIFHVEEGMLPNARGGFSKESPLGLEDVFRDDGGEVRFPWEKPKMEGKEEGWTARKQSKTLVADLTLPAPELRRLRNLTYQIKSKTRIGNAGITEAVVNGIHEKWKTSEIVRIKVEGAPALNMKKMHEILEKRTGGLVIWRSGTAISLYRGVSYVVPSVQLDKRRLLRKAAFTTKSLPAESGNSIGLLSPSISNEVDAPGSTSLTTTETEEQKEMEGPKEVQYEEEVDKLLDGLGPRYTDWPGCDPMPVDADLLPGIVPGYQPPFRILPYGVRSTLSQKEATSLRRLSRFLPPHFALGRSRQLQGLAVAMSKLWERSSIAKLALKRGVQLTTSERMAEDLKKLTGGFLLSRNKDYLVFYRGKNFLSPDVTEALQERERLAKSLQDEEEQARLRASGFIIPGIGKVEPSGTAGTLEETLDADARWGKKLDDRHAEKIMKEAEYVRHSNIVRKLERKLAFAERRVMRAERALAKVEESLQPSDRQADPESITEEERYMFRKIGLRMKAFLLLGRRGVFDGTVENMHLHWKYRELIKIILKAKSIEQVKNIALALEAESGGVLVSVDKVSKGYAIIVYRGKDYQRPSTLRPKNLLTKRKALTRSKEIQRREALLRHIGTLQRRVDKIRSEIDQMEVVKDKGDEELYDRLDSDYPTDDGGTEEEENEMYLENGSSDNDESNDAIPSIIMETNFPYDDQNQESETESEPYRSGDDDYNINGEESDYEVENCGTNFSFNLQDQTV